MQARSRARELGTNEEAGQEGHQQDRRNPPHQEGEENLIQPLQPGREHNGSRREEQGLPPLAPQAPTIQLTPEALQRMIEEASTRAAERAINQFMTNRQREPSPPRSLRRGRVSHSAPEDNESRENYSRERRERPPRREEDAASNRRDDNSHIQNASRQQGGTQNPLPLAVAPARRSPFSMQILAEALPQGIRIPTLTDYDGTGDPEDHLDKFLAKANLLDMSDVGYYKIFCTTLSGRAMVWFNQLPAHTIENFEQLSQRFLHHFSINKKYPKTASYLFTVVQQEQESLRDYVQRFSEAVLEVPHLNHELLASILQQGLRKGRFRESITEKPPTTLDELLKRAAKYIRIEEALKPKAEVDNKRKIREGEKRDPRREGLADGQRHMPPNIFVKYTPLKVPRTEILTIAE
ncbi:UNVERIFIED_CONTAM: hypothetical protein Slati_2676900 [Sesamum latifolium]|uniref:Retrotransposon gag domain-containing protein n=1 Tax=Sesamum latifolium TaxID=2727402 RepID=A0AAW2VYF4_9LAMI